MKIAAIYDIHGNLPALEAVLEEVRAEGVDRIVVGGDVVPGPMPRATLAMLLDLDVPVDFIHGNGELAVLQARRGETPTGVPEAVHEAIRWVAERLAPEQVAALERWPATLRMAIPGPGEVLFCHATPRNAVEIFTRETPAERLAPIFAATGADVVVCGHTHMPFDRRIGSVRVVNAGSVGMPFGAPDARWLLLGPEVEARRTRYDFAAATARVCATAYPLAATLDLEHPASEDEMRARFESVALG